MKIEKIIKFPLIRKLNSLWFYYKANCWRFNRNFKSGVKVKIDRPVYLIGTQNGGLTLLSRILHRHSDAISATGDYKYWAGEDEAQDALTDILPEDFGWQRVDISGFPSQNHGWVYGNNAFLPYYRRRAGDIDPAVASRYQRIIQGLLRQHGSNKRFIDKSQTLTLRVGALNSVLQDSPPYFVLISRDPYAVIWSQVTRNGVLKALDLPILEKVKIAAQHWVNSMEAALSDVDHDPSLQLRHWKFEDLVAFPEDTLVEICNFIDLPWEPKILPSADDHIPVGSRLDAFNKHKWFPLRADVNERYLDDIPLAARQIISLDCGPIMVRLGYTVLDR